MCDPPNVVDALSQDLTQQLFPTERRLVPYLDDVYELELAFYENQLLADEELIRKCRIFRQHR